MVLGTPIVPFGCCFCHVKLVVTFSVVVLVGSRTSSDPLCHQDFRALERCLSNDYERLRRECLQDYGKLKTCLVRDWRYVDDAQGYERTEGSFNRVKRCRHGLMLYNPLDWYIGRSLEVYGEWGERKIDFWRKVIKPGQVAIDIGAHVGTLTLPLASLVGAKGRVLAIEPFYPSFSALAASVGLNSLQNVELRQAVVADRIGRVFMSRGNLAFGMHDFFNFGSMNFNALRIYNTTEDVERPSADWDEYAVISLDHLSLARLDFVKVDAEAMEVAVLRGAARMIKKFKPVLFIEYRSPWEKDTSMLDLLTKKMRYECVLLRLPVFNERNFRGHKEDIWGTVAKLVSFNLLCKHRWWEYHDMDEDVLELFDTAVDTDIEGLRTTPTADPFEAMAMSGREDIPWPGSSDSHASGSQSKDALDEFLDSPTPRSTQNSQVKQKPPTSVHKPASKAYKELTLDELLSNEFKHEETLQQVAPIKDEGKEGTRQNMHQKERIKYEDMTLDELLSDDNPPRAKDGRHLNQHEQRQPRQTGGTSSKAIPPTSSPGAGSKHRTSSASSNAAGSHKRHVAERSLDEISLEELLDGLAPKGSEPQVGMDAKDLLGGRATMDMTLEELLQEPSMKPGQQQEGELSLDELLNLPERKPNLVNELTLDELLGPSPGTPKYSEMSLDGLLNAASLDENGKKYEEMSLDELLEFDAPATRTKQRSSQRPSPDRGDKYEGMNLDELLAPDEPRGRLHQRSTQRPSPTPRNAAVADNGKAYDAMSLDELLALTDPAPRPQQGNRKRPSPRKTGAGPRSPAASTSPGKVPEVKLTYDRELSLDEL